MNTVSTFPLANWSSRPDRSSAWYVAHNLTAKNLLFAHQIGGLPMPSLGVLHQLKGDLHGFGEITLIGRPTLLDPKKDPVYTGDIYSPRAPDLHWSRVPARAADDFYARLKDQVAPFDEAFLLSEVWHVMINSPDRDALVDRISRSNTAKAGFLASLGVTITPVRKSHRSFYGAFTESELIALRPLYDRAQEEIRQNNHRDDTGEAPGPTTHQAALDQELRRLYLAKFLDESKHRKVLRQKILDTDLDLLNTRGGHSVLRWDMEILDRPLPLDDGAIRDQITRAFSAIRGADLLCWDWVDRQMVGPSLYKEPFLISGGKKVACSAENLTRLMVRKGVVNADSSASVYGAGDVRASATRRLNSWRALIAAEDDLVDEVDFENARDRMDGTLTAYQKTLTAEKNDLSLGACFDLYNNAMRALSLVLSKRSTPTPEFVRRALEMQGITPVSNETLELGTQLAREILACPAPYFECKPRRVVGLDEFAVALIPESMDVPLIRDVLKSYAIRVVTYDGPVNSRTPLMREIARDLWQENQQVLEQEDIGDDTAPQAWPAATIGHEPTLGMRL